MMLDYRSKGMGKRSNYERRPRDFYPTPIAAVEPLIPHLPYTFEYIEPCAGDGRLIDHIDELTGGAGTLLVATDIEPRRSDILPANALQLEVDQYDPETYIITNPPWDRTILHPLIEKFMHTCKTWLLFDADWMHTKQSAIYMTYCKKVVSVGRVKWIENSKGQGKDNCCWYLFDIEQKGPTEFYGRVVEDIT